MPMFSRIAYTSAAMPQQGLQKTVVSRLPTYQKERKMLFSVVSYSNSYSKPITLSLEPRLVACKTENTQKPKEHTNQKSTLGEENEGRLNTSSRRGERQQAQNT